MITDSVYQRTTLNPLSPFFDLRSSLEVVWMFSESYSSSFWLLIFLPSLSFCPSLSLIVHISSSQFIKIRVYCLFVFFVFSSFCSDLSLIIHLSSSWFIGICQSKLNLKLSKVPIDGARATDICFLSQFAPLQLDP